MIEAKKYTDGFFEELETNSYRSAKLLLPIVNQVLHPASVIDIGCGTGEWLKVWHDDLGVADIKGIEGPYIKREFIKFDKDKLVIHDLKQPYTEPKKYDLAMSLEVGEHLPTELSGQFVQTLTQLSEVVLFSAAIPGQEGTYHINEQYPEFWAGLFKEHNYVAVDYFREKIWHIKEIEYWYKQNIMLYIKEDKLKQYPDLLANSKQVNSQYLFRLHPDFHDLKNRRIKDTSTFLGLLNWKWVQFKYKHLKKK